MPEPLIRVVDASLHADGGPVHVVVERLDLVRAVADAAAQAGATARLTDHGLVVVARVSQLVDAAGRTGGAELAEPLRDSLEAALSAWGGELPPLVTRAGVLPVDRRPVVMGVVNVTPDSFSDGGHHDTPAAAVAHGRRLVAEGADVVDVGGESTRPGADPVDEQTELARVLPVVGALADDGLVVSIDTTKAAVARAAVDAGAAIVNDVSAGALDERLLPTVAELAVPYVLMHMQGTPRTMQAAPTYDDVVGDVFRFLATQLERCQAAGIAREAVVLDPGIGFGKTTAHNLALIAGTSQLTSLGRPVLVGTSRKRFLGEVTTVDDPVERVVSSATSAALSVRAGATMVRVHDVAETVEAVRVAAAVRAAGRAAHRDADPDRPA